MGIKEKAFDKIEKSAFGRSMVKEPGYRAVFLTAFSLIINLLYALCHGVLGVVHQSVWFLTLCVYYMVLSAVRLSAVLCGRRQGSPAFAVDTERFVMKFSGLSLTMLGFILTGVIYMSLSQNIAVRYGKIPMITIAAYTFGKMTMVVVKAIKQHKNPSLLLAAVRNIAYAEVAASVLTLQRSMLVSFGAMPAEEIRLMNILTGAAVCLLVWLLGIAMIRRGQKGKDDRYGKIKTGKGQ